MHPEVCEKLFDCAATVKSISLPDERKFQLATDSHIHADATITAAMERNNSFIKKNVSGFFAGQMIHSIGREGAKRHEKSAP